MGNITTSRLPILSLLGKRPFGQTATSILSRLTNNWRRTANPAAFAPADLAPASLEPEQGEVQEAKAPEPPGQRVFNTGRADTAAIVLEREEPKPVEEEPAKVSRAFGSTREVHFVG